MRIVSLVVACILLTACAVGNSRDTIPAPTKKNGKQVVATPESTPVPTPSENTGSQTASKLLSPITSW